MDHKTPAAAPGTPLQSHQLVRRTIALVLAGGRGSRLKQLTDRRAKPAVYFGGKFAGWRWSRSTSRIR